MIKKKNFLISGSHKEDKNDYIFIMFLNLFVFGANHLFRIWIGKKRLNLLFGRPINYEQNELLFFFYNKILERNQQQPINFK